MSFSRAIVISHTDFGEADKYVQFYTEKWGMITVAAKAAKKSKRRFIGGLDLFCHSEIKIRGEPNPYLLELVVLNSFLGIRENLDRLLTAGKLITWIKKLANTPIPMYEVYSLLGQSLALIEKETTSFRLKMLFLIFKFKLLSAIGLKPSFEKCSLCGNFDRDVFFDVGAGYSICLKCQNNPYNMKYVLDIESLTFLKKIKNMKLIEWNKFNSFPNDILRINDIITDFAAYHTHTNLPN